MFPSEPAISGVAIGHGLLAHVPGDAASLCGRCRLGHRPGGGFHCSLPTRTIQQGRRRRARLFSLLWGNRLVIAHEFSWQHRGRTRRRIGDDQRGAPAPRPDAVGEQPVPAGHPGAFRGVHLGGGRSSGVGHLSSRPGVPSHTGAGRSGSNAVSVPGPSRERWADGVPPRVRVFVGHDAGAVARRPRAGRLRRGARPQPTGCPGPRRRRLQAFRQEVRVRPSRPLARDVRRPVRPCGQAGGPSCPRMVREVVVPARRPGDLVERVVPADGACPWSSRPGATSPWSAMVRT